MLLDDAIANEIEWHWDPYQVPADQRPCAIEPGLKAQSNGRGLASGRERPPASSIKRLTTDVP